MSRWRARVAPLDEPLEVIYLHQDELELVLAAARAQSALYDAWLGTEHEHIALPATEEAKSMLIGHCLRVLQEADKYGVAEDGWRFNGKAESDGNSSDGYGQDGHNKHVKVSTATSKKKKEKEGADAKG